VPHDFLIGKTLRLDTFSKTGENVRIDHATLISESNDSSSLNFVQKQSLSFETGMSGMAPLPDFIEVPQLDSGDESSVDPYILPPDRFIGSFSVTSTQQLTPPMRTRKGTKKSSGSEGSVRFEDENKSENSSSSQNESHPIFFTQQEIVDPVKKTTPESPPITAPISPELVESPKRPRRGSSNYVVEVPSEVEPTPVKKKYKIKHPEPVDPMLEIFSILDEKGNKDDLEKILKSPPVHVNSDQSSDPEEEEEEEEYDEADVVELKLNDKAQRWLTFARRQNFEYVEMLKNLKK
jgi:hypothetical protein